MKHILSVIVALSFLLTFGHAGVEPLYFDASKPNSDGTYNAVDSKGNKIPVDAWNGKSHLAPEEKATMYKRATLTLGLSLSAIGFVVIFAGCYMYQRAKRR